MTLNLYCKNKVLMIYKTGAHATNRLYFRLKDNLQ